MKGFFRPLEFRSVPLNEAGTLAVVSRSEFFGLTISLRNGDPGVIALQSKGFEILPSATVDVCATPCSDSLLVEAMTGPEHYSNFKASYGWLAVCRDGLALVCRGKDANNFETISLVSLASGRELGTEPLGQQGLMGIGRWRLHRISAKDGETSLVFDNSTFG